MKLSRNLTQTDFMNMLTQAATSLKCNTLCVTSCANLVFTLDEKADCLSTCGCYSTTPTASTVTPSVELGDIPSTSGFYPATTTTTTPTTTGTTTDATANSVNQWALMESDYNPGFLATPTTTTGTTGTTTAND